VRYPGNVSRQPASRGCCNRKTAALTCDKSWPLSIERFDEGLATSDLVAAGALLQET
jgi:hypothetical protein